jgi:cytidine deaminase
MKRSELIGEATRYRINGRAPHSGFLVGAALETRNGKIYGGCNIENATYGLTVCAERVAVWKAVSEGESRFRRIAIVADTMTLTPPCGPCRQILWEYCGDIELILSNLQGRKAKYRLSELFPMPFDNRFLNDGARKGTPKTRE